MKREQATRCLYFCTLNCTGAWFGFILSISSTDPITSDIALNNKYRWKFLRIRLWLTSAEALRKFFVGQSEGTADVSWPPLLDVKIAQLCFFEHLRSQATNVVRLFDFLGSC